MKKLVLLSIGVLIMSCKQTKTVDTSENFDWLLGKWERLNEEEGKKTFENWKKINDTEYSGIGFTLQNKDTISQEKIRLTEISGKWKLAVKIPEESKPTIFNEVSHNENEFTFENNDIDFPNNIKYWKNGQRINALLSGGEMKISFEFKKIN